MKIQKQDHDRLDEKSLHLLSQIDRVLERQYDQASTKEPTRGALHSSFTTNKSETARQIAATSIFSSSYEEKKKRILEGQADIVARELKRKQAKRNVGKRGLSAAAILLALGLFSMIIGPKSIHAAVLRFGKAIVSVFRTHTEYSYTSDHKNEQMPSLQSRNLQLESFLPDGYEIKEIREDKEKHYKHAENSDGQWINLDLVFVVSNYTLKLNTEGTEQRSLELEGFTVNQYQKPGLTIYYWEAAGQVYTLSGSCDKDLQSVLGEMIKFISQ